MQIAVTKEQPMKDPRIERELVIETTHDIHGVTHDGRRLWVATDQGDLHAVDPESGVTIAKYAGLGCDAGLAFDGTSLWAICKDVIHRLDPETGAIQATIPAPERGEVSGMAWAEGFLWIGQYRKQTVLKVDPKTGAVLRRIERDRLVTGVSFVDGALWHASVSGDPARPAAMLHRLDPETMEETSRVAYAEDLWISGLEIDPSKKRFWAGGAKGGKVRALTKP